MWLAWCSRSSTIADREENTGDGDGSADARNRAGGAGLARDEVAPVSGPAQPEEGGVAVDLTAILLKSAIRSPDAAVTESVDDDPTARWYMFGDDTGFTVTDQLPDEAEVVLLVRTPPAREPAWHVLLRDYLRVDGFSAALGDSAGAVLFTRTGVEGKKRYVAWCFGRGSHWIARKATSPRFGLLVALNAAAGSAAGTADTVGVIGATVATRDGILKRASLTSASPAPSHAMPRLDTLADILTAARVSTGHEVLGKVSAGRSLQFPDFVGSVGRLRELSALVAGLATRLDYRQMEGWIDDTVPEDDEQVIEEVLDHIWDGADDQGNPITVNIAWWEDARDDESDHPVIYWRPAHEHRGKHPVRRVTLTWPAVKSAIEHQMETGWHGHLALATDIRFFAADDEQIGRCPVIELLSAEVTLAGTTYALVDGQVCRVDAKFLASLDRELTEHLVPGTLCPYHPGEREDAYNDRAAKTAGFLLLDKTTIHPPGQTKLEPCDILGTDGTLYFVKRHTSAPGMSHLAVQAVSSATALWREPGARGKLGALIEDGAWDDVAKKRVQDDLQRIVGSAYRLPVTLVIVGEWQNPTIKNLSLLSRMALRTGIQKLSDIGYQTRLMLIDPTSPSAL